MMMEWKERGWEGTGSQAVGGDVCVRLTLQAGCKGMKGGEAVSRAPAREAPLIALCSQKTPRDPVDTVYPTVCFLILS